MYDIYKLDASDGLIGILISNKNKGGRPAHIKRGFELTKGSSRKRIN